MTQTKKGISLMEIITKRLILLMAACSALVLLQCTKVTEQAPFFDGLYLKYHETFGDSEKPDGLIWSREIEYKFKKTKKGDFQIYQVVTTQRIKKLNKKIEPVPYPLIGDDLTIDQKGKVLKGGNNLDFVNDYTSSLWLPFDKRKIGAEVIEKISKVGQEIKWAGQDVWPVKGLLGDVHYYDLKTGFLVGAENFKGKLKMVLIDTNLNELAAISKRGQQK